MDYFHDDSSFNYKIIQITFCNSKFYFHSLKKSNLYHKSEVLQEHYGAIKSIQSNRHSTFHSKLIQKMKREKSAVKLPFNRMLKQKTFHFPWSKKSLRNKNIFTINPPIQLPLGRDTLCVVPLPSSLFKQPKMIGISFFQNNFHFASCSSTQP